MLLFTVFFPSRKFNGALLKVFFSILIDCVLIIIIDFKDPIVPPPHFSHLTSILSVS